MLNSKHDLPRTWNNMTWRRWHRAFKNSMNWNWNTVGRTWYGVGGIGTLVGKE